MMFTIKGTTSLLFSALLAFWTLTGCAELPSFDGPIGPSMAAPTVDDVVAHIQCELWNATQVAGKDDTPDITDRINKFNAAKYAVYASLTLDVTNSQGLSPSLNFINPYAVAMTNITQTLGGQLSDTQHRNIVQTFLLDLGNRTSKPVADVCHRKEGSFGIEGDLGLREIILSGSQYATQTPFIFPFPRGDGLYKLAAGNVPTFGTTIDFTLVYGGNAGPTWTLRHFKGPGGASSGLLNLARTEKNTLVITFAPSRVDGQNSADAKRKALLGSLETTKNDEFQERLNGLKGEFLTNPQTEEQKRFALQVLTAQSLTDATLALKSATESLVNAGPSDEEAAGAAARNSATQIILQNLLNSGVVPQQ